MELNLPKLTFSILIAFASLTFTGCDKGKALVIQKTAEEVNTQCPMQVDQITQLVSCEYVPDKTLKYSYTVDTDVMTNDMDVTDIELLKKELNKQIVIQMQTMMSQESLKPLKLMEPTLIHSYKDKKGEVITEITVTPEMYNNPAPTAE